MSIELYNNLKNLNLEPEAIATLSIEEGCDVYVCNDDEVETALGNTSVVSSFCDLVATPGLRAETENGGNILEQFRDQNLLDGYERDGTFSDYLAGVLTDNLYDLCMVESHIEQFDYKRGFCTLSAEVKIPVTRSLEVRPFLAGWEVSIKTSGGTLTLEG
jgi:hypothetical protein